MRVPFVDEQHVSRIITALWSRAASGKAAVLVGAGFSANAAPLRHSQPVMPGWNALVFRMIADLYPGETEAEITRRTRIEAAAPATSAALRIAQEYEAEFNRDALNRLIADNVPDGAFAPGDLHRALLELPWADVLTTNWDTLLERAAVDVEDRVYRVIHTVADIPASSAPRIVKLHGSLPSHRPFIFTEEDFRTYPVRFAPFINLARQTTMENVLVLVGFSGDDPNFLYWSGWVRDQLGEHAPTIYLVGALDLTSSQRKMLDKRGVQPVDLSTLDDYLNWEPHRRRALASQWFIERLTASRPYRRIRWPKAPPPKGAYELVTAAADPRAPLDFPSSPTRGDWTEDIVVSEILPVLSHNRALYPDWVVAPHRARERIWGFLQTAIPEARQRLKDLDPEIGLRLAFEMNWLCEVALVPLFDDLSDPISELLPKLGKIPLSTDLSEMVTALALALLRRARETGDPEAFAQWDAWLEGNPLSVEARSRHHYERCLIAQDSLDFALLDERLSAWTPDGDPFWIVRKAALLAENDRTAEALVLSRDALAAIRVRTDKDREDIASWSREAYALLFRSACLGTQIQDWEKNLAERDNFSDRLLVLSARGCAAQEEVERFGAEMHHSPPPLPLEETRVRGFDVGNTHTTRNWRAMGPIITRLSALQALRFYEETGTPARISPGTVAASAIGGAGRWLHTLDTVRSIGALVRSAGGAEKLSMDVVFSREAVRALSDEEAEVWGQRLLVGARTLKDRINDPHMRRSAEARLIVVLEMLSRLVVRRRNLALPALDVALSLYADTSRHSSTDKPLANLFRRAFTALAPTAKPLMRARLLETPTPKGQGEALDPSLYAFLKVGPLPRDPDLAPLIAATIGQVRDPATRWAATLRVQRLQKAGMLTPEEDKAFLDALWDEALVENGLPGQVPLRSWVFALLPSPPERDGAGAARARLLSMTDMSAHDAVGEIHGAIAGTPVPFTLTARELKPLVSMVLAKAVIVEPEPHPFRLFETDEGLDFEFWRFFEDVVALAMKHASTRTLVRRYFAGRGPVERAIAAPHLVAAGEMSPDEAARMLLAALEGDEGGPDTAVSGILSWLRLKPADIPLPETVWEVAADAVVSRSALAMGPALSLFAAALERHGAQVPVVFDARLHRALRTIISITGDDALRESLPYDPGDARRRGARLVRAMDAAGRGDATVSALWREAAAAERIPEIGRGLEPHSVAVDNDGDLAEDV